MSQSIFDQVNQLITQIQDESPKNMGDLEQFRIKYLGSKNTIKPLMAHIRNIEAARKKEFGQLINHAKQVAIDKFQSLQNALKSEEQSASKPKYIDLTAPGEPRSLGSRHPISLMMNRIIQIFERIGFVVADEREIEDDWHNFTAMNTPADHPARDMQDTFYLMDDPSMLLRTHTSSVQARTMMKQKPPIRIIAPGRVYRNETISARAHAQFHQVEGLYIDKDVSFADMKQTLQYFTKEMYGVDKAIRLRPSYFPFTEPSAEMDVYWGLGTEADYRITKGTGWLEILGCGMVDPQVLANVGIDPNEYSGYAFGMGVERQAMLKYGIEDIRLLFENDIRFLSQFDAAK